ncbi:MAG: hypothetical protein QIT40_gp26 [Lokiarchaeia virus VerdaV4]|uniref:Uncharacterized protein n=1 Tax=Lokiarchaeia virus VerdaV4 TaxID=3070172 RepID=A0AA35CPL7_9CAUD|nr:MAG: hypothetical protein QIT40_gp26 [Lokiarchaeia virus VerdaV4]BDI54984.1 MAG: hypothetical protein [Lokiarchaeia virus VerdaV4]
MRFFTDRFYGLTLFIFIFIMFIIIIYFKPVIALFIINILSIIMIGIWIPYIRRLSRMIMNDEKQTFSPGNEFFFKKFIWNLLRIEWETGYKI